MKKQNYHNFMNRWAGINPTSLYGVSQAFGQTPMVLIAVNYFKDTHV